MVTAFDYYQQNLYSKEPFVDNIRLFIQPPSPL